MPVEISTYEVAGGARACVVATGKADGDFAVGLSATVLEPRRRAIVDRPWVWVDQVHGGVVVDADDPGVAGTQADGLVTTRRDVALAVHTADCVPVALIGSSGRAIGAVHAGWRGLVAGVVERAVALLRERGEEDIAAYIGPCISVSAYEFGAADLDRVAIRYGDAVRASTAEGRPALDLRVGVEAALSALGVDDVAVSSRCTASEPDLLHSYRARTEAGRQALVVWLEDAAPNGTTMDQRADGS